MGKQDTSKEVIDFIERFIHIQQICAQLDYPGLHNIPETSCWHFASKDQDWMACQGML